MSIFEQIYEDAFNNELEKLAIRIPRIKKGILKKLFLFLQSVKIDKKKEKRYKKTKFKKLKRKPKQYLHTEMFGT